MRVKKQKRHRRVVRFYSACFGFREPYKVLLDGTLVHHLLSYPDALLPADNTFRRLLGAKSILFSSKCIVAELRRLGGPEGEAFKAAELLMTARCDHEKVVSAADCIISLIGEKNPEHFFVATQDADLRKKFQKMPGVPVIYGLKNALFIEQPSSYQREFAHLDEEKRSHMNKSEYQKLIKGVTKGKSTGDETEGNEVKTEINDVSLAGMSVSAVERSKFKRNRAKGPNPLSCKKKKPKSDSSATHSQDAKTDGAAKRKRTRKRNRDNRVDKQADATT